MKEIRKGMLLVLSGPSGAGKGTLAGMLMSHDPSFRFSVSATTRAPRPGEVQDVHYHFMDDAAFDRLVEEGAFLEYATVHGNRYGTLRSEVEQILAAGENVLLDIDVQGARQVMAGGVDVVSVFVVPPSFAELRARLEGRGTETPEAIEIRLGNARAEVAEMSRYEYTLVNYAPPERSFECLRTIVEAEKMANSRCTVVLDD